MGFGEISIIIGVILIIIDLFIDSEIPSLIALLLFAITGGMLFSLPVLYKILLIGALFAIFLTVYLLFWRRLKRTIIDRHIAPDRYHNGPEGLIGQPGELKEVDGKLFVKVYDELWGISPKSKGFQPGDPVMVKDIENNLLILTKGE